MRAFFDRALAIGGSVALHAAIILGLLVGVQWRTEPEPPVRTTLKAAVVSDEAFRLAEDEIEQEAATPPAPQPDPAELQREAEQRAEREAEALAQREAEARAQREAEAQAQREAEETAQREAEAQAQREAEAQARREAEEKARREAEAQAKREAEEKARREAEAQAKREAEEKARREAEERAKREAEARAQREQEERRRREEEQRRRELEAQLADALAAEEARAGAIDAGLQAQYIEQIRQKVTRAWRRPPAVPNGLTCTVLVRQLRSGDVVSIRVVECEGGDVLIRSIEAAVRSASPLPPPPDPSLFESNLRFPFRTGD